MISYFLKSFFAIKHSCIFMREMYSEHYLNNYLKTKRHRFVILHYMLIGERRGYLPNPFFDPLYFKMESRGFGLADFIRNRKLWVYSPSSRFDSQWYISQNPQITDLNPLVHFWTLGMDQGRDPSPIIDMRFFDRAVCRDRPDHRTWAFKLFAAGTPDVPWNSQQLRERQDLFYSKIGLEVLREPAPAKNPYLVFVQANQSFDALFLKQWRNFDVLVNYYDSADTISPYADYVLHQKGTKTTAIRKLLEQRPDMLFVYKAILFIDDDISISAAGIESLFETIETCELDLVQASLSPESECHFDILKQPNAGDALTPLTAVEIMMPVISARALRKCGWVFQEGISGWAIDLLLSAKVRENFGNTIALVGNVVACHERDVDTVNGAYYNFLKRHGIDATIEAGDIASRFDLDDSRRAISIHPEPLCLTRHRTEK
jgi:hypothetical protein